YADHPDAVIPRLRSFPTRRSSDLIYHDLGRFPEAASCYRTAIDLNPQYADAHFYLAITLEKTGHSLEAKPHWRTYQQLSPDGERSEEHTSELQSLAYLVCRLLLEK